MKLAKTHKKTLSDLSNHCFRRFFKEEFENSNDPYFKRLYRLINTGYIEVMPKVKSENWIFIRLTKKGQAAVYNPDSY